MKNSKSILLLGIFFSGLGLIFNIYASHIVYYLNQQEHELKGMSTGTFDVKMEELFQQKLRASTYSYRGVMLMAVGFIINNLFHLLH